MNSHRVRISSVQNHMFNLPRLRALEIWQVGNLACTPAVCIYVLFLHVVGSEAHLSAPGTEVTWYMIFNYEFLRVV